MSLQTVFTSLMLIGLIMLGGKLLRRKIVLLQKLFLPSSIIGGVIALLLGSQVLGSAIGALPNAPAWLAQGLWPESSLEVWSAMPGLLISVVFAGLFLGKAIPNPKQIWRRAGPMIAHGQTMAWGQYVVGISLVLVLLTPIWGISPLAGGLIEIGFEGGHGTAAGLSETFAELGFPEGADLALGLATIGVVAGVLLGTLAVNFGVWRGIIKVPQAASPEDADAEEVSEHEDREVAKPDIRDKAIDPMSIHLGFVALAIGIGWLLLQVLTYLEDVLLVPLGWPKLMNHIPLFPLAMFGGVIVQVLGVKLGYASTIDRKLMNRISGTALDFLIVAAMATLSLATLGDNIWVFVILALGGILWNVFGLMVLARFMFPSDWMQKGLANFGQGMGMTVVGLLLVRMSDPQGKTDTMEVFGYKQLMFEPIVGGGLFTAASLPLIAQFGAAPVLVGVTVVTLGWLTYGLIAFRPRQKEKG